MSEEGRRAQLENSLRTLESKRGMDDHLYFCKICGFEKVRDDVHGNMIRLVDSDRRRLLMLLPRGSFKSSVITIAWAVRQIIKNPNIRILIDNEVFDNAIKFVGLMKTLFESCIKLRYLYGNYAQQKSAGKWTEGQFTVKKRTKSFKEPTVTASGIGATKVGMHYNLIIADDLVSDQNIMTKEQKEKVISHYKLLFSLLEPDGKIIIIGTRWSYDDLYGYILENDKDIYGDGILIEKAIADDGKLFFPQVLSKQVLDENLQLQGSYIWNCQYQNTPISSETAIFKPEWIHDFSETPEGLYITMTVDPAIGTKKRNDDTAFSVCGTDFKNNVYSLQTFNGKISMTQTINKIFEYAEHFKPKAIGLEVVAYQKALKQVLIEEMRKRDIYLPVVELKTDTTQSKEMRISALAPRFEFGTIFLKKDQVVLREQILKFPYTSHDDVLDALAYNLQLIRRGTDKKAPKEKGDHLTINDLKDKIKKAKKMLGYIGNENLTFEAAYRRAR